MGERLGRRPRVAIRVNPDFRMKGSGMRMGGGPQQFGVDSEQVPSLLADLEAADVDLLGFHVFAGSQNLNAAVIAEAQEQTVALAIELAQSMSGPVRYLNLGGGFGIPYTDRDEPLDLAAVAERPIGSARDQDPPRAPGRADRSRARPLHRRGVRRVRHPRGRPEGSPAAAPSSWWTAGSITSSPLRATSARSIRRNYPVAIGNRAGEAEDDPVSVVGCLCTPLDVLADDVHLPRADIGDLVVVFQAGAYGLTASPTAFLGHPEPVEVLV